METPRQDQTAERAGRGHSGVVGLLRAVPIRWRILSVAVLNSAVVVVLGLMIWNGAGMLRSAWNDVRRIHESDKVLASLENETSRLQNLIHRYINQPDPGLTSEILALRHTIPDTLGTWASTDPMMSGPMAAELTRAAGRLLSGFDQVRTIQSTISKTYEDEVLAPAKDMAGLYSAIAAATDQHDARIWPSFAKSREAFTAMLVAASAYYLSLTPAAAEETRRGAEAIEQTIPEMSGLADNDAQRSALQQLNARMQTLRQGLAKLSEQLASRTRLLRDTIDASQAETVSAIDQLSSRMRQREQMSQETFDRTLAASARKALSIAAIFLGIVVAAGVLITLSIRQPLRHIVTAMHAITGGDYDRHVDGTGAGDEIGTMARAVEIFRQNAIAKRATEDALRASKEKAESTLLELSATQQNLVDAERLAALGGLVAGVAHEVNNPLGISLTVASSLARRAELFEAELRSGAPLRKSRLEEFVQAAREAAHQLVANLDRAGELVQSFKQVAVDRSRGERRSFSLREATDQIVASLRPVLKTAPVVLSVDVPDGLMMDSYPGAYGQIVTNLFVNAAHHGFADGRSGTITIAARLRGNDDVEIIFADNGAGMTPEVQRHAFEPFFTTRRSQGGTGLGLHIVHSLVTRLGGRMILDSGPGQGTTFRIIMPRAAGGGALNPDPGDGTHQWPNRTTSSI